MKWGQKAGPVLEFLLVLIVLFLIVCFFLFRLVASTSADDRINLRMATRAAPIVRVVKTIYMEISAYSPTRSECDAAPLITASGQRVRVGGIAADLRVLPFGSLVIIPGYNGGKPCKVTDTGSAIKGKKLDVFFFSTDEAIHFGRRRNVRVEVLYVPGVKK